MGRPRGGPVILSSVFPSRVLGPFRAFELKGNIGYDRRSTRLDGKG